MFRGERLGGRHLIACTALGALGLGRLDMYDSEFLDNVRGVACERTWVKRVRGRMGGTYLGWPALLAPSYARTRCCRVIVLQTSDCP